MALFGRFKRKKPRVAAEEVERPRAGRIKYGRPDFILALVVFGLILFGIIMISSASVVHSYQLFGNSYHFLQSQLTSLVIGLIAFIIIQAIPYQLWRKLALPAIIITIVLLIIPAFPEFFPGLAYGALGAHRWIHVGSMTIQPSEIAKLALIIYFAAWLEKKGNTVRDFVGGFVPFAVLIGIISILIMKQPDMGTMFVIAASTTVTFFISGASIMHMILGVFAAGGMGWFLIQSASYRMARLTVFLNPEAQAQGMGYQINQALLAIGSGGLFGLGFGNSRQKYSYLPQVADDSIFAVIVEELGFLRAGLILVLFGLLAWRGLKIARNAPDIFGRLLATGITSWLVIQALINISAIVGLIPLTGITLPFISNGGSSLVICLIGVGILFNISRQSVEREQSSIARNSKKAFNRFFRR